MHQIGSPLFQEAASARRLVGVAGLLDPGCGLSEMLALGIRSTALAVSVAPISPLGFTAARSATRTWNSTPHPRRGRRPSWCRVRDQWAWPTPCSGLAVVRDAATAPEASSRPGGHFGAQAVLVPTA